jgi:hypothetical protein
MTEILSESDEESESASESEDQVAKDLKRRFR